MIAYEIEQYYIQCDIKLNIQAAMKWNTMPCQPVHATAFCACAFWWISSFRICITFAYELKRSLQSLLFDVWLINNIYKLLQDMLFQVLSADLFLIYALHYCAYHHLVHIPPMHTLDVC